jgi:hypothetical protein
VSTAPSHFARLLEITLPKGGYAVSMVEVYFDESGSHERSPVLCVAGYIFESDRAKTFSQEWDEVLSTHGLPFFRMSDCAHGNGPFNEKSLQTRIDIATCMIEIIKRHASAGIASVIKMEQYDRLMPYHQNLGGSYTFCIVVCLAGVLKWIQDNGFEGDISYFFEAGHKSQSEANRIMELMFDKSDARREYCYASHTFVRKEKAAPVQAADLLAWQCFTESKKAIQGGGVRRKDFASLITGSQHNLIRITDARILEIVEVMKKQDAWRRV